MWATIYCVVDVWFKGEESKNLSGKHDRKKEDGGNVNAMSIA